MSKEIVNSPASPSDLVLCNTDTQGVFLLELNRPEKLNALSKQLLKSLETLLQAAKEDPRVHCVVLTGSQKAFSVGADIHDFAQRGLESYLDPERLEGWRAIEQFPKPIIAAVNGYAIGGGVELAMVCDIVIAGENAKFGQGEITIGSIPGEGGTQRLPRFVGKSLAMQMILTGQTIDASQALRAGLVSEVTASDQTVSRALEIARRIAELPMLAVQMAKQAVLKAFELPLSEGLAHERELVEKTFQTEDRAEGLKAFLEKRKPKFTGR
jgi:enoyl-CoA hydratase